MSARHNHRRDVVAGPDAVAAKPLNASRTNSTSGIDTRADKLRVVIRRATSDDIPAIHEMIGELAEYERARHEVRTTPEQLRSALFGPEPAVYAHIAEDQPGEAEDQPGEVAGFALWFLTFSTWRGVHGIYLEDLYVRPRSRGGGHGRGLLTELARICVERGYQRLEWAVLDWNEPAIGFYRSMGAEPMDEWTTFRLTDEPLRELSQGTAVPAKRS